MIKKILLFLVSFVFCFNNFISQASAHDASLTYSSISVTDDTINVAITTPYANIEGIYPEKNKTIDEFDVHFFNNPFQKGFQITNDGQKCTSKLTNTQKIPRVKEVAYQFVFTCAKPFNNLHFNYNLFFDVSDSHENITDLYIDKYGTQFILSKNNPTYDISVSEIRGKLNTFQSLWTGFAFLKLGVEHIFGGYDHILFLLGLLILAKRFRSLIKVVTGFTIAHSLTLIISSLGIFTLPQQLTESLIALSIVYVAWENIKILYAHPLKNLPWWKKILIDPSKRYIIAFLFGLIHGFGFASVLAGIGLPQHGLIVNLLLFNLGVEIGQLIIIALAFPIILYCKNKPWETKFGKILSILIGLIGIFWFIQRVLFF